MGKECGATTSPLKPTAWEATTLEEKGGVN